MNSQKKSVDDWWNEMDLNQKQILRLMVQMLGKADEGEVLEVRRTPGRLVVELVKRPESKGTEAVSAGGTAQSSGVLWHGGPGRDLPDGPQG